MEPEKKELILDDQYFAAYFHYLIITRQVVGLTITPYLKNPRSVGWKVCGDNIFPELEKIYSGAAVPLLEYVRCLKEIRNQIAVLKG